MNTQKNACCVYDFTANGDLLDVEIIKKKLNLYCKKWGFQKEEGKQGGEVGLDGLHANGYIHWQGRLSTKIKCRMKQLIDYWDCKEFHFSITSKANRDNLFYVIKKDTQIEGPWLDTDEVIYIPRQIREVKKLYPWQEKVLKISKIWDTRTVNIIIDTKTNIGKTTLKTYIRCHRLGRIIPFCNNYKDILRMVCDMPTSTFYIIDMPKTIDKEKIGNLFSAIETIKDGYAYDDRYKFTEKIFDCPNIFVFTNEVPDETYLSKDRWKLWEIIDGVLGATLEPYKTPIYI